MKPCSTSRKTSVVLQSAFAQSDSVPEITRVRCAAGSSRSDNAISSWLSPVWSGRARSVQNVAISPESPDGTASP